MSYGINVIGANSQVILDESLPYFGVVAQGTAPAKWTTDGSGLTWVTIPSNVTNPLLVIKGPRSIIILKENNRFTCSLWNFEGGEGSLPPSGTVINYYDWAILDTDRANWIKAAGTHGLRVQNGDGVEIFDSNAKIFTVDASFNLAISVGMSPATVSLPPPRYGTRYVAGESCYTGLQRFIISSKQYVSVDYLGVTVEPTSVKYSSQLAYAYPGSFYAEDAARTVTLFTGYMQ